jgi:hexosaminidase
MLSSRICATLLTLAACTALSPAQTLKLVPMPREVQTTSEVPLTNGVRITCASPCSADDKFAADDLISTLKDRGIPIVTTGGLHVELFRLANHPVPGFTDEMKPEGYVIASTPTAVVVTGATPEGVFYGAQTVKQLIAGDGPHAVLHGANIHDWPAMKYRGLDDDLSRGPFPTLDFQKRQIRIIAAYKVNLYSPYFENTQAYVSNPVAAPFGGNISAEQARELVAYAKQFHIVIIPEQEAFGHLHKMLQYDQYSQLAETPHGGVLAPGQDGSIPLIKAMFAELAAIYPGPFLHLGADETQELGSGQTQADVSARGLGPAYMDFMARIVEALKPLDRKLLFWGDIAYHTPALVKNMPQSFKDATIAVPWTYNPDPKGFDRYIQPFTDAGYETWVAPGINNWSRVFPNYINGLYNIQQFTRDGQRLGCDGQLNTIWNDDGEGLENMDWYGILFGAAAAWQKGESSVPQFQNSFGQVFHGDLTGKVDEAQKEFMAIHALLREQAKLSDANDALFWLDPWSPEGVATGDKIRPYVRDLRIHAEHIITLVAQARAAAIANGTTLREQDALDAMDLGARRADLIGFKFEMADEMAENYRNAKIASAQPAPVNGRGARGRGITSAGNRIVDIRDYYSAVRDEYAVVWLSSNRPYYLSNILARYDHTIQMWMDRTDKVRAAQRDYMATQVFPSPEAIGMPASAANPPSATPPPTAAPRP